MCTSTYLRPNAIKLLNNICFILNSILHGINIMLLHKMNYTYQNIIDHLNITKDY